MTDSAPAAAAAPMAANCRAVARGGVMQCERCARAWSADQGTPACKPVTFGRLWHAAERAARQIEEGQAALVAAKMRATPDLGLLTMALELRSLVRLVERITTDAAILRALSIPAVVQNEEVAPAVRSGS